MVATMPNDAEDVPPSAPPEQTIDFTANDQGEVTEEVEMNARELQEQGKYYQNEGNHKFALFYYTESLRRDVHSVECWLARAMCWMELDRMVEAVKDCNAALRLDFKCAEGYRMRAKCLQRLKRVTEAIVDMEYVQYLENMLPQPLKTQLPEQTTTTNVDEIDDDEEPNSGSSGTTATSTSSTRQAGDIPGEGMDEALDYLDELRVQARLEVAKEMKDHYLALAVDPSVEGESLKKAYRDAAMKWHPDRWSCAHPTDREMAEDCFKECSFAYQVLKDQSTRHNYDRYLIHRLYDPTLPHPADAPQHYLYQQNNNAPHMPPGVPPQHPHQQLHHFLQQQQQFARQQQAARGFPQFQQPPQVGQYSNFGVGGMMGHGMPGGMQGMQGMQGMGMGMY